MIQLLQDLPFKYDAEIIKATIQISLCKRHIEDVEDPVRINFEQAMDVLEEIATIDEVEFPDMPYEVITRTIMNAESASAFDDFS